MRAARSHDFIGFNRKSYRNWRNTSQSLLETENCLEMDPNKCLLRKQGMRRTQQTYLALLQPRKQRHKHHH